MERSLVPANFFFIPAFQKLPSVPSSVETQAALCAKVEDNSRPGKASLLPRPDGKVKTALSVKAGATVRSPPLDNERVDL
jgi:hypothetical protein